MKIAIESIFRYAYGDSFDTDRIRLNTVQSGWTKGEITHILDTAKNVQRAPECSCKCHASCVSLSCICNMAILICKYSRHGNPLHCVVTKKQNNSEYTTDTTCNLSCIKRKVPSKY